mgnify:CR=1 FL=1
MDGKVPTIAIGAGIGAAFGFIGGVSSEIIGILSGNQKNINWKNVLVDTASGLAVGAIAGTGVGIGYLVAGGMSVGAGNYVTKVAANGEFKSKSLQEHFVDGAISSVVWGISAVAGGTMQKEVKEKLYKKQEDKITEKLREKFDRYINGPTKVGGCFVE